MSLVLRQQDKYFPTPKPEVAGKFVPPAGKVLLLVGQNVEDIDSVL